MAGMVESERDSQAKYSKIPRRSFITQVGLLGGSVIIGAGSKVIEIQNKEPYPIAETELLDRINKRPDKNFQLGLHPNSLEQLKKFKEYVGGRFIAGAFATERTFRNPDEAKEFKKQIEDYHSLGGTPIVAVGLYKSFNNLHPFDIKNEEQMRAFAQESGNFLNQFPFEIWVRPFIEAELPSFCFGINHGLPLSEHQEGFRRSFNIMAQAVKGIRSAKTQIHFSPWVDTYPPYDQFPIDEYFPGNENLDGAGADGYDFFPGYIDLLSGYFWKGKFSPEEIFAGTFRKLLSLTKGQKDLYVYEAGSASDNSGWLTHAVFYAMSIPQVKGFIHFGVDKRNTKEKINWAPGIATLQAYSDISRRLLTPAF